jgi:hypothetical protein
MRSLRLISAVAFTILILAARVQGQTVAASPTDAARSFFNMLDAKRWADAAAMVDSASASAIREDDLAMMIAWAQHRAELERITRRNGSGGLADGFSSNGRVNPTRWRSDRGRHDRSRPLSHRRRSRPSVRSTAGQRAAFPASRRSLARRSHRAGLRDPRRRRDVHGDERHSEMMAALRCDALQSSSRKYEVHLDAVRPLPHRTQQATKAWETHGIARRAHGCRKNDNRQGRR